MPVGTGPIAEARERGTRSSVLASPVKGWVLQSLDLRRAGSCPPEGRLQSEVVERREAHSSHAPFATRSSAPDLLHGHTILATVIPVRPRAIRAPSFRIGY